MVFISLPYILSYFKFKIDFFLIKVLKQKAKNPNLHGVVSSSDYYYVWYTDLVYFNTQN